MLEGLLKVSKTREARLEEKLQAFENTIHELEAQVKGKEEELSKREEYVSALETHLVDVTSKGLCWESLVALANQRLNAAHAVA